jgi:hypothetical protein
VAEILRQHSTSQLFETSEVALIPEKEATAANILKRIKELGEKARPNDLFVLFLSGHGDAPRSRTGGYQRGAFFYICRNSDAFVPETLLRADQLNDALIKINARKLILVDACHSGAVGNDTVRAISGEARFLILSACKDHQKALEPRKGLGMSNGLFTQGLLSVLKPADKSRGKRRSEVVTAEQLGNQVKTHIGSLLIQLKQRRGSQIPEFFPQDPLPPVKILCRP